MAVDPTGAVGAITDLANEANAQIDALSGELVQAQHELSAADQQIAARDELNAALEAQVATLQQQLADCQSGQEPDPLPDPEPSPDPDPLDDGGAGTTPGTDYAMTVAGCVDLGSKKTASNTWDQAFDAAIADAKTKKTATGVAPAIMFPAGERVALSGTRTAYDGMCLIGPGIGSIQRSANSIQTDVRYSGAGPMFVLAATTFDVTIVGLSIQGNNAGIFFDTKGFVLWESTFRDMGMNGWKHIWGTPASKFLNTLCTWDGPAQLQ
jgi:hypothetical protein